MIENIKQINLNHSIDINKLPEKVQEKIYYNFFFDISDFIYNIWNLKIIDYDEEIQNKQEIKTSILNTNEVVYKDTIKNELKKIPLAQQLDKLFFNREDYEKKFKFYLNYMQLKNSFSVIKTEELLDMENDIEELSIFFERKI